MVSINMVRAPVRAAKIAAPTPAGPPPQTSTSTRRAILTSRLGDIIVSPSGIAPAAWQGDDAATPAAAVAAAMNLRRLNPVVR